MLSEIVCRVLGSTKGSILGHTSSLNYVSVMVQKIAVLCWLEYLSWSCVFLAYICWGIYSPEVLKDWFIESVIYDRKTEVLDVFVKLWFWDWVASWWTIEFLDHENCLLDFLPDIILVFSSILYIRMISKVESFLYFTKICCFFGYFHLTPQSIKKLLSVLWHFASNRENKFRETDKICTLFIEYVENMIYLCVCDVYPLLFYYLLEFFIVEKCVFVSICSFHCFLKW